MEDLAGMHQKNTVSTLPSSLHFVSSTEPQPQSRVKKLFTTLALGGIDHYLLGSRRSIYLLQICAKLNGCKVQAGWFAKHRKRRPAVAVLLLERWASLP